MTFSRERLVTIALVGGLTATFVAAVHLPGHQAAAEIRGEIARAESEIARGPQVLAAYKAASLELDGRLAYLAESAAAVGPADPHDLLARISRLARESRLAVRRLEPEAVRSQASYDEHPFRLDFRGDLRSLAAFLRGLETGPRLFAVDDLTVSKPSEAGGASLEGSLRFRVFAERVVSAEFNEESGGAAPP